MEDMNRRDVLKKLGAAAAIPAIDAIVSRAEAADRSATVLAIFSLLGMTERYQLGSTTIDAAELGREIESPGPRRIIFESRLAGAISMRLKEIAGEIRGADGAERSRVWEQVQRAVGLIETLNLPDALKLILKQDIEAIRVLIQRDA